MSDLGFTHILGTTDAGKEYLLRMKQEEAYLQGLTTTAAPEDEEQHSQTPRTVEMPAPIKADAAIIEPVTPVAPPQTPFVPTPTPSSPGVQPQAIRQDRHTEVRVEYRLPPDAIQIKDERIPVSLYLTPAGSAAGRQFVITMVAASVSDEDNSVCLLIRSSDVTIVPPALGKFTVKISNNTYTVMGVGVAHKIGDYTFIPLVKIAGE